MSDDDWDEEDEDIWVEEEDDMPLLTRRISYEVINTKEIQRRQAQAIEKLADEMGLEYTHSAILLIQNQWNPAIVLDKIINNEIELPTFKRAPSKTLNSEQTLPCILCYSEKKGNFMKALECSHAFCISCYSSYLKEAVLAGKECIFTKCPMDPCSSIVPEELFKNLLPKKLFDRYKMFIFRSFVDDRSDVKWCPAPDCTCAVSYPKKLSREINCECGFSWCFGCGQESHRPLTCETLTKWNQKVMADDNETWILANTKPCPKCKNAIQKNLGCMHMTCKCGYQFCWLCLGDWSSHGSVTGGFYRCNKFTLEKKKGKYEEEEKKRLLAAYSLKRFEHYYERYLNHKASIRNAKEKISKCKIQVEYMYGIIKESLVFDFYIDAASIIYNAVRSLAYSYALGYFLTSESKLRFYEFIQGELESNVILLEGLLRRDLTSFLNFENDLSGLNSEFINYRVEVVNLTTVVSRYFNDCLTQMENGFPDVEDKGGNEEGDMYLKSLVNLNFVDKWICAACTLANELSLNACIACGTARVDV